MKHTKIHNIDPHFSESSYVINRDLFKNYDPDEMSKNSSCPYDPENGRFEMTVLGETYFVDYPSGMVVNARGEDFDNYSVVNPERQIDFWLNDVHYSVTLTAHRAPKKKA